MFFVVVVTTILAAVHPYRKFDFPTRDVCWFDRDGNGTDLESACPLDSDSELSVEDQSSCVITLRPLKQRRNMRCAICEWRQRFGSGMCRAAKSPDVRHCCCRKPMCNKKLFEDTEMGWSVTEHNCEKSGKWCEHCLAGSYDASGETDKWTFDHDPPVKWCNGKQPACLLEYTMFKDNILNLNMGCATEKKCRSLQKFHPRFNVPCETVGNKTTCCCHGAACNSKIYRQRIFDTLMKKRNREEEEYLDLLRRSKLQMPKVFWFKKASYHERMHYLSLSVSVVIPLLLAVTFFLLRRPAPMDLELRMPPYLASLEQP